MDGQLSITVISRTFKFTNLTDREQEKVLRMRVVSCSILSLWLETVCFFFCVQQLEYCDKFITYRRYFSSIFILGIITFLLERKRILPLFKEGVYEVNIHEIRWLQYPILWRNLLGLATERIRVTSTSKRVTISPLLELGWGREMLVRSGWDIVATSLNARSLAFNELSFWVVCGHDATRSSIGSTFQSEITTHSTARPQQAVFGWAMAGSTWRRSLVARFRLDTLVKKRVLVET